MKLTKEDVKLIGGTTFGTAILSSYLTEIIKTDTDDKFYDKCTEMCFENDDPLKFYLNVLGKVLVDMAVPAAVTTAIALVSCELTKK